MTRSPMKVIYEPPLRTVLVGGSAGYAAQALCRMLASDGALRVISVDRFGGGSIPCETGNFRAIDLDAVDQGSLATLFPEEQVDSVVAFAGRDDVDLARIAQSCWGQMADDQRARCRFVSVTSPDAALRRAPSGVPTIRAIVADLYGPGQPETNVIPATILSALAGAPIWVFNGGLTVYDWLHVDDLASALLTVLIRGQPGTTYQISARETHSALATTAMICDLIDRLVPRPDGRKHRSLIRFRAQEVASRGEMLNPEQIERALGWHAEIGLRDGVIDAIDWYRTRLAAQAINPAGSAIRLGDDVPDRARSGSAA